MERRRLAYGLLGLALVVLAVEVPRLLAGGAPAVLSAAEARHFPEFGEHGGLHFFTSSATEYLRQNRSGFDLAVGSGSVLALAAICCSSRPRHAPPAAP